MKTHPHIDSPSDATLTRIIDGRYPAHRELYLSMHRLVLDALPGLVYSVDEVDGAIGYGARQFGYDGWGMAALTPYRGWVSLGFLRGARLSDPDGLLGGSGALVRHVNVRSLDEFADRRDALRELVRAAAQIGR